MFGKSFAICIFVFFAALSMKAQQDTTMNARDLLMHRVDSLRNAGQLKTQTPQTIKQQTIKIDTEESKKQHSPTKATLLSTFLPGAGQVYNGQWWKVPIIYAAFGTITYFAITNWNGKEKFKDEYYARVNGEGPQLHDYLTYSDQSIYNLYTSYKDNFQLSIIIGVAFYAVQLLDAYVYGHLFSFDLSDDLSFNWQPYLSNRTYGLSLSLSF